MANFEYNSSLIKSFGIEIGDLFYSELFLIPGLHLSTIDSSSVHFFIKLKPLFTIQRYMVLTIFFSCILVIFTDFCKNFIDSFFKIPNCS